MIHWDSVKEVAGQGVKWFFHLLGALLLASIGLACLAIIWVVIIFAVRIAM